MTFILEQTGGWSSGIKALLKSEKKVFSRFKIAHSRRKRLAVKSRWCGDHT